jgi:8-oxo-dGTP pyrophosphatase MutT (NUDIX family)
MSLAHVDLGKSIKNAAGDKNIMEEIKREISILIPYKKENGLISVYLQKRLKSAKRLPDYFGFFGGGIENEETIEQGLRREMEEEIGFIPEGYVFFRTYEFPRSIKNIYTLEVDDSFEKKVTILEGEYGKWFSKDESYNEKKLIDEDKLVLKDLFNKI